MPKRNFEKQPVSQADKFKAAAKQAGADMCEAELRQTVDKIAKAPKPESKTAKMSDQSG